LPPAGACYTPTAGANYAGANRHQDSAYVNVAREDTPLVCDAEYLTSTVIQVQELAQSRGANAAGLGYQSGVGTSFTENHCATTVIRTEVCAGQPLAASGIDS
jgi:hypothetical protein